MTRMGEVRVWMMALCSLVVCGACSGVQFREASGRGASGHSTGWLEFDTRHFRVRTDLPEPSALDLGQHLEEARAALVKIAWGNGFDPLGKTRIYAFSRPGEFQSVTGFQQAAGLATSALHFERALVFHRGAESGLPRVVVHEIAHDLAGWFLPAQPAWFSEGMAGYQETLTFDRERGVASLGAVAEDRVEFLKSAGFVMRTEKLFARSRAMHGDVRDTGSFYAGTWLLVHYLVNHYNEKFVRFQRAIGQFVPWKKAWQASFGDRNPEQLNDELTSYARRAEFTVLQAPVAVAAIEPQVRRLSRAEAEASKALVAFRLGNLDEAKRRVTKAGDGLASSLEGIRALYELSSDEQERATLAERAIAEYPEAEESWLLSARSSANAEQKIAAIRRAARSAPDHPAVRRALAQAELDAEHFDAALDHVEVMYRRSGDSFANRRLFLRVHGRAGNCRTAQRLSTGAGYGDRCTVQLSSGKSVLCNELLVRAFREACSVE